MLQKIELTNFKCFDRLELTCAPVTLLCGLNGMGKSSVFQALLVLRQSAVSGELDQGHLVLSGELASLGTGQDVLFEGAESDVVAFELHDSAISEPCYLAFDYARGADQLSAELVAVSDSLVHPQVESDVCQGVPAMGGQWRKIPPLGGHLIYLGAERLGPRKFYDRSEVYARHGNLGTRGEYAWNYLYARQSETMANTDPRCLERSAGRRMLDVVDHWLQEITPGAHVGLSDIQDADSVIAGFSFDRPDDVASRWYRTTNVGFGLSYTLPVLMALLAPSGSLCLIENPEAHLHPWGQTRLAELAVRASLAGVQVIAETHSDHFMDGVRIAVREGLIQPSETAFHYFERNGGKTVVSSPEVSADGRLSSWPAGFFDQHEENLSRLIAPKP